MATFSRTLAAALLGAVVLAAQEAQLPRLAALGRVIDAAGTAHAAASVELWSMPLPGDQRFGEIDLVHATTDERGRFRAAVLPGRSYAAFAYAPLDGECYHASPIRDGVVAGVTFALTLDERPVWRTTIEVVGVPANTTPLWMTLTPMSSPSARGVTVLGEAGRFVFPTLPGGRAFLRLHAGERRSLMHWSSADNLHQGLQRLLGIGPTREYSVAVVDEATGTPLRDAWCESFTADQSSHVVDLDDEGTKRWSGTQAEQPRIARAPGHAPRTLRDAPGVISSHQVAALPPGRTLHGRLLLRGAAAPGVELVVMEAVTAGSPRFDQVAVRRSVHSDANGDFAIDGLSPAHVTVVHAILAERHLAALPLAEEGLDPLVQALLVAPPGDALDVDCGEIALDGLDVARIAATDSAGVPVPAAELFLDHGDDLRRLVGMVRCRTDRSGRHRLLLPPSRELRLVVRTPDGVDGFLLRSGERESGAIVDLVARLRPQATICGRCLDADGEPRGGVGIGVTSARITLRPGIAPPGRKPLPSGAVLEHEPFAHPSLLIHLLNLESATSDDRGEFALTVPRVDSRVFLETEGTHVEVTIPTDHDPAPVEIGPRR
ncbi:MAG: hypothetical protein HZB39_10710 [Planctomycetes bacterium]|nr:hypothetical protein [Planctomycetota bacterium]